jgi:hypothetical protein
VADVERLQERSWKALTSRRDDCVASTSLKRLATLEFLLRSLHRISSLQFEISGRSEYIVMMPIPLLDSFLKLASALVNALLGRKERRAQAATLFRDTFLKELKGLYPLPSDWPATTGIEPRLKKAFPALQAAVSAYRPSVPKSEQAAFDEAWLTYRTATRREIDVQSYTHYMNIVSTTVSTFGGQTVLKNDGKASFKRNVDRLLAFAQDA